MSKGHISPSKQRYNGTHRTFGITVALAIYERLMDLKAATGLSLSVLVQQALGILELNVGRAAAEAYERGKADGHAVGFEEGHTAGLAEATGVERATREKFAIQMPCRRCGKPAYVLAASAIGRQFAQSLGRNWIHDPRCPEASNGS